MTEEPMDRLKQLLTLHRRFHAKVGCPGGESCYVCKAEDDLKNEEQEILKHGDPLSGDDWQAMRDVRNAASKELHVTPNIFCHCGHSLLSHKHYPPEAQHCGYPPCKCLHFIGKPTPPDVLEAVQLVAAYVKETAHASVTIGPEGGSYFTLKQIR